MHKYLQVSNPDSEIGCMNGNHLGLYPFIRITVGFILGIQLGGTLPLPVAISVGCVAILATCLVVLEMSVTAKTIHAQLWRSLMVQLLVVVIGWTHSSTHQTNTFETNSGAHCLIVTESGKQSGASIRFLAHHFVRSNHSYRKKGQVVVYVRLNNIKINKGDLLITLNQPKRIESHPNPGSFNFQAFAKRSGMTDQFRISEKEFVHLPCSPSRMDQLLAAAHRWVRTVIKKYISDPHNQPLAEAMLIGYREDLSREQLNAYTQTGIVHIIAISGMHLALIFMILERVVRIFSRRKASFLLSLVLIIPLLWLFALLTGSSASVLRSVVMFTVISIGNAFNRKSLSINVLFGSAFLLLLYHPFIWNDLGFQLSYAAVLSILIFQKLLENTLVIDHPLGKMIWSLTAVTLSAQVLTTPIILYQFNRFPTLFLFANLIAVPASSFILVLEIILCAVSWITPIASLTGKLVSHIITLLNSYVETLSTISFVSIQTVPASIATISVMYLLIAVLLYAFKKPSFHRVKIVLFVGLLLGGLRVYDHVRMMNKRDLFLLHCKEGTAFVHRHGNQATLTISSRTEAIQWGSSYIQSAGPGLGIDHWKFQLLPPGTLCIRFESISLNQPDLAMISNWPATLQPSSGLFDSSRERIIVLDGTIPMWKISQWKSALQPLDLRLHSTAQKGPLMMDCLPFHKTPSKN